MIYGAFSQLCTEGAVRYKVKTAKLLPRLMELCKGSNIPKILLILYYFQYDKTSMAVSKQDYKKKKGNGVII